MTTTLPSLAKETIALRTLFNGTFFQSMPVSEDVYGAINAFFLERTGLQEAADALTENVLTIAYAKNYNPIDILKEFDKAAVDSDLKKILLALFNSGRFSTSKLGYGKGQQTNKWVDRNIIA